MKDWVLDHMGLIYFGVWAVLALAYGYFNEDPNDKKAVGSFGAVIFGLWPIGAFFAAILSPLWIPMALAELGAYLREKKERKDIVKWALKHARPLAHSKDCTCHRCIAADLITIVKCDNCAKPKHEGDCKDD